MSELPNCRKNAAEFELYTFQFDFSPREIHEAEVLAEMMVNQCQIAGLPIHRGSEDASELMEAIRNIYLKEPFQRWMYQLAENGIYPWRSDTSHLSKSAWPSMAEASVTIRGLRAACLFKLEFGERQLRPVDRAPCQESMK